MRRTSVALAVTLLVGIAWLGWRSTVPTSHLVGANVGRIAGEVVVVGGPAVSNAAADIHPVRSAPILVRGSTTSGKRVVRRFAADREGRFGLTLPAGRYTFTAVLYQGSIPLAQEPHAAIHVRVGDQSRVEIVEQVS